MSQSKADKLLSRITSLHRHLREDEEEGSPASEVEKDLMLGYLRDLYAFYRFGEDAPTPPRKPVEVPAPPPPPPAPAPEPAKPAPIVERPAPATPPKVPDAPVPPPPAPTMTERTATVEPVSDRPAPHPPQPAPAPNLSADVESLFSEPEENGMTSKIMRQRVSDLTRALSINNRVLYSNKLFNDNEELNAALKQLNLKGSMANAKPMLIDLAQEHHWSDEERQETAREFIDLVRRRYA